MNKFTQMFFEADGAGGGGEPAPSGDPFVKNLLLKVSRVEANACR